MKSNREAKRLLGMFTNGRLRVSNLGWLVFSANYPHLWMERNLSARQNRARKWHKKFREIMMGDN